MNEPQQQEPISDGEAIAAFIVIFGVVIPLWVGVIIMETESLTGFFLSLALMLLLVGAFRGAVFYLGVIFRMFDR